MLTLLLWQLYQVGKLNLFFETLHSHSFFFHPILARENYCAILANFTEDSQIAEKFVKDTLGQYIHLTQESRSLFWILITIGLSNHFRG